MPRRAARVRTNKNQQSTMPRGRASAPRDAHDAFDDDDKNAPGNRAGGAGRILTMSSLSFVINDRSTGGAIPVVQVTITANADGTLTFKVEQLASGGYLGDLRGIFFDIGDESLIGTLQVAAASGGPLTEVRQGNDNVVDLGQGANMNGLLGTVDAEKAATGAEGNGYDVGLEIGTAGIATDDVRSFEFTLSSSARSLTLADFDAVDFGVRITSIGAVDESGAFVGKRSESTKIVENIDAILDDGDATVTIGGTAQEDQILAASFADNDPDGAATGVTYQWLRDGVEIVGETAATYAPGDADVGATIKVRVGYIDGQSFVETITSAPTGTVIPFDDGDATVSIIGTAQEDQVLAASFGNDDPDGAATGVTYQWQREGIDIAGATAATYTLGDADVGATITVRVGYIDGQGFAEMVTSPPTAPVVAFDDGDATVTIGGTAQEDQVLAASFADNDPDGAATGVTYQWLRDGVDIFGATGATYTLGDLDVGAAISVAASYTDGQGFAETIASAPTAPVAPFDDGDATVAIGGVAQQDQVLTANFGNNDPDGAAIAGPAYQWLRNGTDIVGAASSTYTLTAADVGATIAVRASYADGQNFAEIVTSAATAPVAPSADVNDSPVLNPAASPVLLPAAMEDAPLPAGAVGTLVASLVDLDTSAGGLDNVTDPDSGALTGIAITAAGGGGTWHYSLDNGANWFSLGPVSAASARLLAADAGTRLYFRPNTNFDGDSTITLRAWDQTTDANGAVVNTTSNGGSTAFSTATDVATIDVTPVNDAPVLSTTAIANQIARVSTTPTGGDPNSISSQAEFSADGTKTAFSSWASDIVAGDTNNVFDIYVKNLATGATTRVSTDAAGAQGNGESLEAAFSPDGARVAFASLANNLVAGDGNFTYDIFVKSLATGAIARVNTSASGAQATGGASRDPVFSPDGTKVMFWSDANNLVAGDTNATTDIFIKDLLTGAVTRVNTDASGAQAAAGSFSYGAVFSPDGTKIAFQSNAANLVAGDTNGAYDIFVKDLATGAITRVSTDAAGAQANGGSGYGFGNGTSVAFSPDGTKLAFGSAATNLVAGDSNSQVDIFVKDLVTGAIARVSTDAAGNQANASSNFFAFSPDGTKIAFDSHANNLVPGILGGDTNNIADVFIKDLATGAITRVSTAANGDQATSGAGGSVMPAFSPDGARLIFGSDAFLNTPGGQDGASDIFMKTVAPTLYAATISEDPAANPGTRIDVLLGGFVTDIDAGALKGAAIIGTGAGSGQWQFSLNNGASWSALGAVSGAASRLLAHDALLRFVPDAQWSGFASLSLRAWDQTSGTNGGVADTTLNGGTTAFSAATANAEVIVATVNDAPFVGTDIVARSNQVTSITIPEWALLRNDGDADNPGFLDVNGVTGFTDAASVVHTAGGIGTGSVAFNDSVPAGGTFTYQATDSAALSGNATVTIGTHVSSVPFGTGYDIIGNVANTILVGTTGTDRLFGSTGNDILLGGAGNDPLLSGIAGDDWYGFGLADGVDTIFDGPSGGFGPGTDRIVFMSNGAALSTLGAERLVIAGSGSQFADELRISYNTTHQINITDHYSSALGAIEHVQFLGGASFLGYQLGSAIYNLSFDNANPLDGGGGQDIIASSSALGETLNGFGGNDLLFGNGSNDTLHGGTGNDLLVGGAGDDNYSFAFTGDGTDTISEAGGGVDQIGIVASGGVMTALNFERVGGNLVLSYNGQQATIVNHFAGAPVESILFVGGGTFLGYQLGTSAYLLDVDLTGGTVADVIASTLNGETLNAGTGNDLLFGNAGNDTINGAGGADLLLGGAGADTLNGGDDADVLVGGADADTLSGDLGDDRLVFVAASDSRLAAMDTVNTFVAGGSEDEIDLTAFGFAGAAAAAIKATTPAAFTAANTVDFFDDAGTDRAVAVEYAGGNARAYVDANKDGNFTAADDMVVQVNGAAPGTLTVGDFIF
jgi:Tol biopolymer transport system component